MEYELDLGFGDNPLPFNTLADFADYIVKFKQNAAMKHIDKSYKKSERDNNYGRVHAYGHIEALLRNLKEIKE